MCIKFDPLPFHDPCEMPYGTSPPQWIPRQGYGMQAPMTFTPKPSSSMLPSILGRLGGLGEGRCTPGNHLLLQIIVFFLLVTYLHLSTIILKMILIWGHWGNFLRIFPHWTFRIFHTNQRVTTRRLSWSTTSRARRGCGDCLGVKSTHCPHNGYIIYKYSI